MTYNSYTNSELINELKKAKKEIDILRERLAKQESSTKLTHAIDLFKYCIDALTDAGLSKEEAFDFIVSGFKGAMKL